MKYLIACILLMIIIAVPACGDGFSLDQFRRIGVEVASRVFLDAEEGTMLIGYDQLAFPNDVIQLEAQLIDIGELGGIQDATLTFYEGAERIGIAQTNADGLATIPWNNRGLGDYYFEVQVTQVSRETDPEILELNPANFRVNIRPPDTEFIIVDLDHTLVDSNFFMVLLGQAEPMTHSQAVMQRLSARYSIIYLTHRPDILGKRSRDWLAQYNYPVGTLVLSELSEAFGASGAFKTQAISELRDNFPNLVIGIGDKISDVQSYLDNHMDAYLIPNYDPDDRGDVRDLIDDIENIRGRWRLQVVDNWQQIEQGIFDNQSYPWYTYTEQAAQRVGLDNNRNNNDDDNDDDDDDDD